MVKSSRTGEAAIAATNRGVWRLLVGAFWALCAVMALGCASSAPSLQAMDVDPRLLTGETVFQRAIVPEDLPNLEIFAVNDAMRAFIAEYVADAQLAKSRFERIMRGLAREGYFDEGYEYDAGRTLTAMEAFDARAGNCLSYTTMFIALARAAGLAADYQIVDVPPTWDAEGGFLIRYSHVNAVVTGGKIDTRHSEEYTVDFNVVQPEPDYSRRRISDPEAMALFYSNRSVDHIVSGDPRTGFAYLRKALEIMPENVDMWLNLGAFYSKQEQPEMAVLAHRVALEIDPSSKGAMAGLARSYARMGEQRRADYYAQRVHKYHRRNPFFHFARAQAHFERGEYESSLQSVSAAIELRGRNSRFYFLKGLTQERLGDVTAARESFRKAQKLGNLDDAKVRHIRDVMDAPATEPPS
jgi:Flp pilus assembly protein TadD